MEKISVVIPCYNPKTYIFETLESIYNQTRQADEIFIVDDGSTDLDSKEIFNKIFEKYPEIKFIRQENRGISGAVNAGAKAATGSIIFPIDCDDVLHSQYIEKYIEAFEDPTIDAVTGPYIAFKGEGKFDRKSEIMYTYRPIGLILPDIFLENCGGGSNSAFRKSMLEEIGYFDEMYKSFQDWGMWFKMIAHGKKLKVLKRPLYFYRVHGESDTRTNFDKKYSVFFDHRNLSLRKISEKRPDFFMTKIMLPLMESYKTFNIDKNSELQLELQAKINEVKLMKSSKFWKIRNSYLYLKNILFSFDLMSKYQNKKTKMILIKS